MHLTDLPQDILLAVYNYVSPQDLLALNQTCRTLHAVGTSDYAWHQLRIELPLEIDQRTRAGKFRPFHEIRRSLLNAFRVEDNWRSKSTQIRRLTRVFHGDILTRVQLLKEDWLITLSRNNTTDTSYLSAWHIPDAGGEGAHCAAKVEVARRSSKFAAAIQDDGSRAIIALFNNYRVSGEFRGVEIFSLSLTEGYLFDDAPVSPLKRVAEICYTDKDAQTYDYLEHRGLFVEVQANNNIVAVSVTRISKDSGPPVTYQIILVNLGTLAAAVLQKRVSEDVSSSRFTFKLFPHHIAILFAKYKEGSLYWRCINDALLAHGTNSGRPPRITHPITLFLDDLPVLDIDSLSPVHTCEEFGLGNDITFTAEMLRPSQETLALISCGQEKAYVFRLTLSPSRPALGEPSLSLDHTTILKLKPGSLVESLVLGRTGHRMILLQRSWETDEYRLTKVTLPMPGKRDVAVHELIPPHVALPFQFHRCISIWFEEATGRICFGLHTGEVYLLEV